MFGRMRALLFVVAGLGTAAAYADSSPAVHAGAQVVPPVHATEPVLTQDLEARRNIRGCNADEPCSRPSELLHEYELEAFPRPGANPWVDERTSPPSRVEAGITRRVKRPSELRPDQPWLDRLEMPDLPVTWSPKLIDYLLFYKDDPRGRSIMSSWLAAQGRYRDLIVSHLRKAHLPVDLLYDAMIESSYSNDDSSSAGALGLWQFMPQNGKIYGLRQDRWVDERKDPLRATIAMTDVLPGSLPALRRLGDRARRVQRGLRRRAALDRSLQHERLLRAVRLRERAAVGDVPVHAQGARGGDRRPQPRRVRVRRRQAGSGRAVGRGRGPDIDDVRDDRARRRRERGRHQAPQPTAPPRTHAARRAGLLVRVPTGAKPEFAKKLAELESEWSGYDAYVLAHGERLEDVATTYGLSLSHLRKLNEIDREADLEGGTVLVVPKISAEQRDKNKAKAKAKLLGSGVDQKDGEPLIVPIPDKDFTVAGKRRVFYRVVSSDTVASVAKALAVKRSDLRAWNELDADGKLHPRMVLVAWVSPSFDAEKHDVELLDEASLVVVTRGSPEHLDLAESRTGRVRSKYVAKGKEKLADIAKKFGMGSHDLARINRISYDTVLDKGESCIVYEVEDPGRSKRADKQWHKTPRARRGKLLKERAQRTASRPDEDPVTSPSQVDD